MSQTKENASTQNQITQLIKEHDFIIVLTAFSIVVILFFMISGATVSFGFATEFSAGMLGILWGFTLERLRESGEKKRISKQIINSLLVELNNSLELISEIKSHTSIDYFVFFQTSAWDMFSPRLELDVIDILYDLGEIYHRFNLFNEGMKIEGSVGGGLPEIYDDQPDFLDKLEIDIKSVIERLNAFGF